MATLDDLWNSSEQQPAMPVSSIGAQSSSAIDQLWGATPSEVPIQSGWMDQLKKTGSDLATVITNPSIMAAQGRVGWEKIKAGAGISGIDQGWTENAQDVFNPNREATPLAEQQRSREGFKADYQDAKMLEKGVNQSFPGGNGPQSFLGKVAQGVTGSIATQLPSMAVTVLFPPAAPLMLSTMFGTTYDDKYAERISEGYSPEKAHESATWHGATEVATEMIGLPYLTKVLKAARTAGVSMAKPLLGQMLTETVGELAATNLQEGEDIYTKNSDKIKPVLDWIGTPAWQQSMIDTAAAAIMQTGVMGVGMSPIKQSYTRLAEKQAAQLEVVIQKAREQGLTEITVGDQVVPIEKLEKQKKDIVEAWEINPESHAQSVAELQKIQQGDVSETDIVNASLERLAEGAKPETNIVDEKAQEIITAAEPVDAGQQQGEAKPELSHRDWARSTEVVEDLKANPLSISVDINGKAVQMDAGKALALADMKLTKWEDLMGCLQA